MTAKEIVKNVILPIGIIVIAIIVIATSCSKLSSSKKSDSAVYCWYCSKVIYNDGKAIHCKRVAEGRYTCDYCGKENVID
ncbi:MAG: hypothetical protein IJH07_00845 [Ruminococcus sp.]|nr:hypothetical protein [Ruminococcus sp.]